jgi:UDP-N-acetyl-D-mannosaminuronic acid dehydrogenase
MLLAVSRVNESVPLFLVEGLKRRIGALDGKRVAVLGLAFKSDTDDERDSLSHKLVRLLERELADVAIHDPHVPTPTQPLTEAVLDADAVIVATNHPEFCTPDALRLIVEGARRDAIVVDPWNCWGAASVFAHADELVVLAGLSAG